MIKRHNITRNVSTELQVLKQRFEKNQKKLRTRIEKGASINLNAYKDTPLELALFTLMSSDLRIRDDIFNYLENYIELGISHLKRVFSDQSQLTIEIGSEIFEIERTEKKDGIGLVDWWQLFSTTLILRKENLRDQLYALLPHCLALSKDPFWLRSMDLVLMCVDRKEFENSVLSDLKRILNSGVVEFHSLEGNQLIKSSDSKKLRKRLFLPVIELYHLAYQKDENSFNQLLMQYLIDKKNWIIENKEEEDSRYWIDFLLIGCCSYANDKGIEIIVESEYIPSWLYKKI